MSAPNEIQPVRSSSTKGPSVARWFFSCLIPKARSGPRPRLSRAIQNHSRPARITSLRPGHDEATNYFAGAGWGAACGAGVPKFTFGTSRDPSAALK